MHNLDRLGGVAALYIAASYIFGFGLFFGVIDGSGYEGPAGNVAFVADNLSILTLAMIVLYPLAACALTVLVVSLNRVAPKTIEGHMQIATAFGLIWAGLVLASGMISLIGMQTVASSAAEHPELASSAWMAIVVVQDALGGGNELLGGIWMAMVSWLFLHTKMLPKPLGLIGIVLGAVGIVTIIPSLGELVDIFGLGQIVWFAWLGIVLLRRKAEPSVPAT